MKKYRNKRIEIIYYKGGYEKKILYYSITCNKQNKIYSQVLNDDNIRTIIRARTILIIFSLLFLNSCTNNNTEIKETNSLTNDSLILVEMVRVREL